MATSSGPLDMRDDAKVDLRLSAPLRTRLRTSGPRFRAGLVPVVAASAITGLVLTGCSASSGRAGALPMPAVTLPPGDLVTLVPRPEELPAGLVPLLAQTGPADLARIAGFSGDKVGAAKTLRQHGFLTGYVVEYADPAAGRVLTVVVTRFASVEGASKDLSADLVAPVSVNAQLLNLGVVGDASGALTQPRPSAPQGAQLVTVRFRVGDTTWLVAVASNGPVDPAAVHGIATALAARARVAATTSPSPSAS